MLQNVPKIWQARVLLHSFRDTNIVIYIERGQSQWFARLVLVCSWKVCNRLFAGLLLQKLRSVISISYFHAPTKGRETTVFPSLISYFHVSYFQIYVFASFLFASILFPRISKFSISAYCRISKFSISTYLVQVFYFMHVFPSILFPRISTSFLFPRSPSFLFPLISKFYISTYFQVFYFRVFPLDDINRNMESTILIPMLLLCKWVTLFLYI